MPIEIQTIENNLEKIEVKIIKNPFFEQIDLRREILKRALALNLK